MNRRPTVASWKLLFAAGPEDKVAHWDGWWGIERAPSSRFRDLPHV